MGRLHRQRVDFMLFEEAGRGFQAVKEYLCLDGESMIYISQQYVQVGALRAQNKAGGHCSWDA